MMTFTLDSRLLQGLGHSRAEEAAQPGEHWPSLVPPSTTVTLLLFIFCIFSTCCKVKSFPIYKWENLPGKGTVLPQSTQIASGRSQIRTQMSAFRLPCVHYVVLSVQQRVYIFSQLLCSGHGTPNCLTKYLLQNFPHPVADLTREPCLRNGPEISWKWSKRLPSLCQSWSQNIFENDCLFLSSEKIHITSMKKMADLLRTSSCHPLDNYFKHRI